MQYKLLLFFNNNEKKNPQKNTPTGQSQRNMINESGDDRPRAIRHAVYDTYVYIYHNGTGEMVDRRRGRPFVVRNNPRPPTAQFVRRAVVVSAVFFIFLPDLR